MTSTPSDNLQNDTTTRPERETLAARLAEAGLDVNRCGPVEEGTKRNYHHDVRCSPIDCRGDYAVFGGDGLVILDIDVEQGAMPDWLMAFPSTLEVRTPHDGRHRLYAVADDSGISNVSAEDEWGSLRAESSWYAVGPGSSIDHEAYCSTRKDGWPGVGTGRYQIENDRPIALLSGESLDQLRTICGDTTSPSPTGSDNPEEVEMVDLDSTVRRRLKRAEDFDWGDQFIALKAGRYSDAGFGKDRSRAEFRLVEILGWLFDDQEEVVRQTMTAICRLNPQTNAGRRKWLNRDGQYRDLTINAACQHDSTYNPPSTLPYSARPDVGDIIASKVYEAVLDLRLASSAEIAQHETVDRSKRQVQRALKLYHEQGLVQSIRDGRRTLYYFQKEFVPLDQREEYGL